MMILIVGSVHHNTAIFYKKINVAPSSLFTGKFSDSNVYHTSLADCPDLVNYINQFDKIYWAGSSVNEFEDYVSYFDSLCLLKTHGVDPDVDPYNINKKFNIQNYKSASIFLGCSHTSGWGLADKKDSYKYPVAEFFKTTPVDLSAPGKGNFRSFTQFNQIDFYENQPVVLQLTDIGRLRYFPNSNPEVDLSECQLFSIKNRSYIDVYNDKQLLFMMLERLNSVVKIARLAKIRFVFFNLGSNPDNDHSKENNLLRKTTEYYLRDYPEYIPDVLSQNIDLAIDNSHFGPKSQLIWSKLIIEKIEKLYNL